MKKLNITIGIIALFVVGGFFIIQKNKAPNITSSSQEVNIFTSRHYDSDETLYKDFEKQTGIRVNVISGKAAALQKRIEEEGKNSSADLYIASDAGRLGILQTNGLLQSIYSKKLNESIPENFRTDQWFGIAKRARIFFYSPKRVKKNELNNLSYEDLAKEKWKGRVVIRKSNNVYNQSLVAALLVHHGEERVSTWVEGLVNNMARAPQGNDRSQILAVAAGEADLAVANSYYFALMKSGKKGKEQQQAANRVVPFFPNQNSYGVHMNISGAGVLKHAPNKENAIKFLEFLLSPKAQKHIVNNTFEYPMLDSIQPNKLVDRMGLNFKKDTSMNLQNYADKQKDALRIMIENGWK